MNDPKIPENSRSTLNDTPEGDSVLILALAGGKSQGAAAVLAGLDPKTVWKRLKDPAFRGQIEAVRKDMIDRAVGHMAESAVDAVVYLRNLLQRDENACEECGRSDNVSASVTAARALLDRLNLGGQCQECKRRAEGERNRPPLTLDVLLAEDARIKAELAEARIATGSDRSAPNILAYEEQAA